jgi:hypothetical protein
MSSEGLKILRHNAREELEHAAMVLEWLRCSDQETDRPLRADLFTDGSIRTRGGGGREVGGSAAAISEVAPIAGIDYPLHGRPRRSAKTS